MPNKRILIALFAILFLQQAIYSKESVPILFKTKKYDTNWSLDIWPVFFGGGNFFYSSEEGFESHWPGYALSGGLTISPYYFTKKMQVMATNEDGTTSRKNVGGEITFFFADILYSYRNYNGFPQHFDYHIEETSMDFALGLGFLGVYIGSCVQIPLASKITVKDWTLDDFNGLSRSPSFYGIFGYRRAGRFLGVDFRVSIGQGPGHFLSNRFGDRLLTHVSLGIMGGL